MKRFPNGVRSYIKWRLRRISAFFVKVDSPSQAVKPAAQPVVKTPAPEPADKYCIVCDNPVHKFIPLDYEIELFHIHHVIGGGLSPNCICPSCNAYDRERWIHYVLKNKLHLYEASGRVLHFAPERVLLKFMSQSKNIDYYTCDITPGRAMHIVDITDIQFRDNTFDYVICNHVLEHIPDEQKAISEVLRVLKPDGKWIFSFPICTDMQTYEDPTVVSEEDRLQKFGQEDHVRLYGYDYKERFEAHGLNLEFFSPQDELSAEEIEKYGFIPDDVIIVATKHQS